MLLLQVSVVQFVIRLSRVCVCVCVCLQSFDTLDVIMMITDDDSSNGALSSLLVFVTICICHCLFVVVVSTFFCRLIRSLFSNFYR